MPDFESIENTHIFSTPVGSFSVFDKETTLPFSVRPDPGIPYEIYDDSHTCIIGHIEPENCYQIEISTDLLEIGKEYTIRFSAGSWEYCDSDEFTICYCTTIGNWMVGIGAWDFNERIKLDQTVTYSEQQGYSAQGFLKEPPEYNEAAFTACALYPLDEKNGFRFRLLDRSMPCIQFSVGWLSTDSHAPHLCFDALGLWLA